MTSTDRHEGNIAFAKEMVAAAAAASCDLIAFPEVAGLMNSRIADAGIEIGDEDRDPFVQACAALAAEHGIWVHTGSTPIRSGSAERYLNRSNLIDASGRIVARYDKIHLFDIYPEDGSPILESRRYAPGRTAIVADTPWGKAGMSICYDIRFPQFYRDYALEGVGLLFAPSAFTVPTGEAHWEVLVRARAIENGAFMIASAQVGEHDDGRVTYGHGLVVDPWGRVLLDMEDRVGLEVVDLDLEEVSRARSRIPSLKNGRSYTRRTVVDLGDTITSEAG